MSEYHAVRDVPVDAGHPLTVEMPKPRRREQNVELNAALLESRALINRLIYALERLHHAAGDLDRRFGEAGKTQFAELHAQLAQSSRLLAQANAYVSQALPGLPVGIRLDEGTDGGDDQT